MFKKHKRQIIFHQKWYSPRYIGSKSSTFCQFPVCKILVTRPGAPTLGLHKPFISTNIAHKFQFCTPSAFWVIDELINFHVKNRRFLCFFVRQFMITWPKNPKIVAYDAFINSFVETKFQLSRFNRLLWANQSSSAKIRKQKQRYYRLTRSPNNIQQ